MKYFEVLFSNLRECDKHYLSYLTDELLRFAQQNINVSFTTIHIMPFSPFNANKPNSVELHFREEKVEHNVGMLVSISRKFFDTGFICLNRLT